MIFEWFRLHQTIIEYLGTISLVTFFLTLIVIPFMVTKMPADYFAYDKQDLKQFHKHHPIVRVCILVIKNVFGLVFVCAGIAMLVLPGQGVLTILIGLTLISFPKKRALEYRMVQNRRVKRTINWIRSKANKEPIRLHPQGRTDHMAEDAMESCIVDTTSE